MSDATCVTINRFTFALNVPCVAINKFFSVEKTLFDSL